MKKIVLAMLIVASLLATMTSCGKFTCDICGDEKSGKKHKEEVFGEEVVICKDCYEDMEDLADLFK